MSYQRHPTVLIQNADPQKIGANDASDDLPNVTAPVLPAILAEELIEVDEAALARAIAEAARRP